MGRGLRFCLRGAYTLVGGDRDGDTDQSLRGLAAADPRNHRACCGIGAGGAVEAGSGGRREPGHGRAGDLGGPLC